MLHVCVKFTEASYVCLDSPGRGRMATKPKLTSMKKVPDLTHISDEWTCQSNDHLSLSSVFSSPEPKAHR